MTPWYGSAFVTLSDSRPMRPSRYDEVMTSRACDVAGVSTREAGVSSSEGKLTSVMAAAPAA